MAILTKTLTVIVHSAEEGGYWAEVLEIPGCVSQGETLEELNRNIREAIEAVGQYEDFFAELPSGLNTPEFRVSQPGHGVGGLLLTQGTGTSTAAAAAA